MSDLETETTGDGTATIEYFGRSWSIPAKRQHAHIRRIKEITRTEGYVDADDIAEVFLSGDEFKALLELNVTESELDEFAKKIGEALGVGDSGNSEPSSASS